MHSVIAAIEVEAPLHCVFAEWMAFERFPLFMDAVQRSTRIDAHGLRWLVRADGEYEEWKLEPGLLIPRRRLTWKVVEGPEREHVVTFHDAGASRTLVRHRVDSPTGGPWTEDRVVADLGRMKALVEAVARA